MSDDERDRVRGLKALVHDAVDFTVDRVEQGQNYVAERARQIVGVVAPSLSPIVDGVELLASTVPLATVRAINRLIEKGTDPLLALRPQGAGDEEAALADAAIGALNGAVGDYLHQTKNPLALGFSLRHGDLSKASRIAVFVHGLATTEQCWWMGSATYHGDPLLSFGNMLERDLGITPVWARYNTGRSIADNGRLLAEALEVLPPVELILIGHSMGGLVARVACAPRSGPQGSGAPWVSRVSRMFSLGGPHQGAPLEKLGHVLTEVLGAFDHPGAAIPAEILKRRSEGVRDLREGVDVPLCDHIAHYFLATTMTEDPDHPLGQIFGDVMVRVPSASGPVESHAKLEIARFGGIMHHQIQNHPAVYAWMKDALTPPR